MSASPPARAPEARFESLPLASFVSTSFGSNLASAFDRLTARFNPLPPTPSLPPSHLLPFPFARSPSLRTPPPHPSLQWRHERLRRLQLRRPLTASEQAQWDRPWPAPGPTLREWLQHAKAKHARRKEALMAKREAYLSDERQRTAAAAATAGGEAAGGSRTVDWRRWEAMEGERLARQEAVEALPADLDWGRIGLLGQLATERATEGRPV